MSTEQEQKQPDGNEEQKKVEFTPEQQVKLKEIIDKTHSSALAKSHDELTKVNTRASMLEAELEAAKSELTSVKSNTTKEHSKAGEAQQLQAQIDEMKRAHTTTLEEQSRLRNSLLAKETEIARAKEETTRVRKHNAIQQLAAKEGFVNPELVIKVTEDAFKWDDQAGKFVVVGADGASRVNSSYEEMSMGDYFKEFAASNPYLVRSDVKSGSGSTGNKQFQGSSDGKVEVKQIFGKNSDSRLASELMKRSPEDYKRMKAVAKSQGLIP